MMDRQHTMAGLGLLLTPFIAMGADPADGWQTQGTNTLRLETYDVSGDTLASPYPFQGGHYANEISLYSQRRVSPFEFWRAQVSGVVNDSEYRSGFQGVVPEVLSLFQEKGDGPVPYRMELGDFYGYYSYRTLQRNLKGAQFEIQPLAACGGDQLSIVFTTGSAATDWRNLQLSDDYTRGVSVLYEADRLGRLNANLLHNSRNADSSFGTQDRDQWLFSLAGERAFKLGSQRITVEGEWGLLSGDHDGDFQPGGGQNRDGTGAYAQLSGQGHNGIHYRARYERYDDDYRPAGAFITADRRLLEGQLGWRNRQGLQITGRYQNYRDQYDSANPQDTEVLGVQITGPLAPPHWYGLNGSIDLYQQSIADRSGLFDNDTTTLNASLSAILPDSSLALLTLLAQDQDDRSVANNDSKTWQASLSVTRSVLFGEWFGSITPGVMLSQTSGGFLATKQWQPTLAVSFAKGPHSLSANYGNLRQRPRIFGAMDSNTQTASLAYAFTHKKNVFGIDANWFDQALDPGDDTGAYQISAYWTHYFGNASPLAWLPASTISGTDALLPVAPVGSVESVDDATWADIGLLAELAPGTDLAQADQRLSSLGLPTPLKVGDYRVYETSLLPNILQRQRLVIEAQDGQIRRSALIIAMDETGSASTDRQQLESVREALIGSFGRPTRSIAEGDLQAPIAAAVNRGQFIDLSEWSIGDNLLRLGIPRRLDAQVRIEIHHAHQFDPARNTRWSLEAVR